MGILDSVANVIFGKPPDAPGVDPSLQRAMQNIEDLAGTSEDILKNIYGFSDEYFKTTLNPLIQANIQRQQSYLTATEDFLSKTRLSDQDLTDISDIRRSFLTDAAQDRTEEMQRKALADYRGQAERERQAAGRLQARYGINPIAMGQRVNQQAAIDALNITALQNQAADIERDRRMRAQATAMDIGARERAATIAGYNQLNTMGTDIYNMATAPLTARQNIGQFALGGYGNIANMYNQVAAGGEAMQQVAQNRYAQQSANRNALIGLTGQVAGMAAGGGFKTSADGGRITNQSTPYSMNTSPSGMYFAPEYRSGVQYVADGGRATKESKMFGLKPHTKPGKVKGPGNGIDDKIPAMLSNGEYVIPADVVEKYGVSFFDSMVQNNHVPAAIQRQKMKDKENKHRKKQMKKTKGNVLGKKKLGLA